MDSEFIVEQSERRTICPEQLGKQAQSGDDTAIRALLSLDRVLDGQFIRVVCVEHQQDHAIPIGAFVLGRGNLL